MEARKNCSYLFEDGRGKNCPKTFLGSPLKTKTMAINFGVLKLISYSYCRSHCTTKYGFTVLFLKKIILSWWRHQSLSNVMVVWAKIPSFSMTLHVSSYLVFTKIVQLQTLLTKLFCSIDYVIEPISVWVDRASVTQTVNLGSIPGQVKPKTMKIVTHSFFAWLLVLKEQCEAFIASGRLVGKWQLDLKTKRSLCCLLAKATRWIKCNYNCINFKTHRSRTVNCVLCLISHHQNCVKFLSQSRSN